MVVNLPIIVEEYVTPKLLTHCGCNAITPQSLLLDGIHINKEKVKSCVQVMYLYSL